MWLKSIFKKREKTQKSVEDALQDEETVEHIEDRTEDSAASGETLMHKVIMWSTNVISGDILSKSEVKRHYPYVVFLLILAMLYITHIFSVQRLHREHSRLTAEVKNLRAKSLTITSYRMQATRQSSIVKMLKDKGSKLEESLTPNVIIEK